MSISDVPDDDSSDDFELEAEFSTVRLGVNYRF